MSPIAGPLARLLPAAAEHRTDGELLAAFTDDRDEAAWLRARLSAAPAGAMVAAAAGSAP